MIEDARLHLALADEMLSEAAAALVRGAHRTAVDRAYYAMVHAASALLAADGERAGSHGRLIARLGERFAGRGGSAASTIGPCLPHTNSVEPPTTTLVPSSIAPTSRTS